jgi:hypothetical protein
MSETPKEDPELYENEGEGDEAAYDGQAVAFIPFDPIQFVVPPEFEVDDD